MNRGLVNLFRRWRRAYRTNYVIIPQFHIKFPGPVRASDCSERVQHCTMSTAISKSMCSRLLCTQSPINVAFRHSKSQTGLRLYWLAAQSGRRTVIGQLLQSPPNARFASKARPDASSETTPKPNTNHNSRGETPSKPRVSIIA